jgi:nitroimidazol reductase NimA-like FMN-containing flavoprotein (pyridoxamine 5'-phosphate oxidase superfamily)
MERQDVAEVLAKPISQELLGSSIPVRLAYVGTDGAPRVIPIGFAWTGEHVVVATLPGSAKVRALQQNPRVALTIDTVEPHWAKLLDFETTIPEAVEDLVRGR